MPQTMAPGGDGHITGIHAAPTNRMHRWKSFGEKYTIGKTVKALDFTDILGYYVLHIM